MSTDKKKKALIFCAERPLSKVELAALERVFKEIHERQKEWLRNHTDSIDEYEDALNLFGLK